MGSEHCEHDAVGCWGRHFTAWCCLRGTWRWAEVPAGQGLLQRLVPAGAVGGDIEVPDLVVQFAYC